MKEVIFSFILVIGIITTITGLVMLVVSFFDDKIKTSKLIILLIATVILTIAWVTGCVLLI